MRELPPLNGIKAFEAAARSGSFTRAASELGVSSAAVSQQVRLLEQHFGKQLFVRLGNRVTLTDAGHLALPQASRALGDLAALSARLLEPDLRSRVVVSAPHSLAELWLVPRLAGLASLSPGTPVEIRAEEDPVAFDRNNIDLRFSYGGHHYPGMQARPLFRDAVMAVCAPAFWQERKLGTRRLETLGDETFIHIDWGPSYASHPSWADWFRVAGSTRTPDPARGQRVSLSALAIAAARAGLGLALGQRSMTLQALEENRLLAVATTAVPLGQPYVAFVPPSKAERPVVRLLLQQLMPAAVAPAEARE